MLRGNSGWTERSAEPHLPYVGHVAPGAVLLYVGSLLAMGAVARSPRRQHHTLHLGQKRCLPRRFGPRLKRHHRQC